MKKWILFLILIFASVLVHAQGEGNTIMLKFAGVPSGPCSFIMMGLNSANGNLYSCPAGSWVLSGGGGGGSGTVSNCTAAGNAFYSAAGTTVSCDTSITDSGSGQFTATGAQPQLIAGANAGTGGQIAWRGATSGTVTCTAPAVAGTTTNGLVCTNNLVLPGNAPALTFGGGQGFGNNNVFGNVGVFAAANNTMMMWVNGGVFEIPNSSGMAWSSTIDTNTNPPNTEITRTGNGLVSIDTTSVGNGLGSWTTCRTSTNVTPVTVNANVNTDQNLMAFTIPANCLNTVGRTLRVFVAGVYSTAASSTAQMTLKIKICSVSGCGSGNVASVISIQSTALGSVTITNNAWSGTFYVTTQTGSTAGAWEAHGPFGIDLAAAATAADSFFNDSNTTTVTGSPAAIDTTAQNFLQITFAFSAASASNSVTQRQLVIDSVL